MRYYPLATQEKNGQMLSAEYESARQIGKLRLGEMRLYFQSGRKRYYLPYADIRRFFRRVMLVPAKLCCGEADLEVENLVLCGDVGELAQVQLPGTRAAKIVMEELARLAPAAEQGRPDK